MCFARRTLGLLEFFDLLIAEVAERPQSFSQFVVDLTGIDDREPVAVELCSQLGAQLLHHIAVLRDVALLFTDSGTVGRPLGVELCRISRLEELPRPADDPDPSATMVASRRLTTKTSIAANAASGIDAAGAALSTMRPPAVRARPMSAAVSPRSISSWRTSVVSGPRAASGTSAMRASRLAPLATTIWFSPVGSTHTVAHPVARPLRATPDKSTPSRSSSSSAVAAKPSRPTQPYIDTSPPARLAANAWFAPLPPGIAW